MKVYKSLSQWSFEDRMNYTQKLMPALARKRVTTASLEYIKLKNLIEF